VPLCIASYAEYLASRPDVSVGLGTQARHHKESRPLQIRGLRPW